MIELLKDIVFLVGICGISLIVGVTIVTTKEAISDWIAKKKWEYKCKHRFDKKPVAKCYCKDCAFYYDEECKYWAKRLGVLDNDFCSRGIPKKTDPEK